MSENRLPPELEFADNDYSRSDKRAGRVRMVAWIVIVSMVVAGGGATVFALLFG